MLAALGMLAANWRDDSDASHAIRLAEQSKDEAVRAKVRDRTASQSEAPKA
jgi:hypothetical protein